MRTTLRSTLGESNQRTRIKRTVNKANTPHGMRTIHKARAASACESVASKLTVVLVSAGSCRDAVGHVVCWSRRRHRSSQVTSKITRSRREILHCQNARLRDSGAFFLLCAAVDEDREFDGDCEILHPLTERQAMRIRCSRLSGGLGLFGIFCGSRER